MEIVWLVIGVLIGLLVGWWCLSKQCKKRLAEKDAELVNVRLGLEQAFEHERSAHDWTKRRLSESEAGVSTAAERAESLERDLTVVRGDLENSNAKNAEADSNLNRFQSDMRELEYRLNEANRANTELAAQLKDAHDAGDRARETSQSRILGLERRIRDQESKIAGLRAELGSARSMPERAYPTVASDAGSDETPLRTAPDATGSTDDLTKIKGIGQVLQGKLHQLGVSTFQQIADFSQSDIERVNAVLAFPGRIEREQWVAFDQRELSPELASNRKSEGIMPVLKIIEIMGESPKGWDAATKEAVSEASKTVKNIKSVWIKDQRVQR